MGDGSRLSAGVLEGDILLGKYRVERVLGSGGMGMVVAAQHLRLEQRVAIKFLVPEAFADPAALVRFDREARAAAKIKSQHVAQVTDVGTLENGAPYMVMEYLEGEDLAARLRRKGPFSVEEAVDLMLQACEAIREAHRLGIVHRDLKPANLFCIREADGSRFIKVLDFGISKLTSLAPTTRGMAVTGASSMMGSPLYMSPEQMQSPREVDERTDIWGIGVVLYELLTGDVPFKGETLPEVCLNVATRPAPPLRRLRPDAPQELERVIARCLEKDRTKRFSSIGELAAALLSFASSRTRARLRTAHPSSNAALGTSTVTVRPAATQSGRSSSPSLPDSWGHTKKRFGATRRRAGILQIGAVLALAVGGSAAFWLKRDFSLRSTAPASTSALVPARPAVTVAAPAHVVPNAPAARPSSVPVPISSPAPSKDESDHRGPIAAPPRENPRRLRATPRVGATSASPAVPTGDPEAARQPVTRVPPEGFDPSPPPRTANTVFPASPAPPTNEITAAGAANCTLHLTSIPASEVMLDGVPLGTTPQLGIAVSSGVQHTVTFAHSEEGKKVATVICRPDEVKRVSTRFGPPLLPNGLEANPYR